MRFEYRTFWLPKDADETAQYQDAFALDAELGRAAIADGVSSAIFSGPWARLLTLAAVAEPPPLDDTAAFQIWLTEKRTAWANGVDTSKLTWYQRPKMIDGAMTTLLWLDLLPAETNQEGLATRYRLQTFAIGDTCLFHVRESQPLYWFPLEGSAEFGLNPAVVASVDRRLDHLLEFKARSCECLPGDLLVLATDAIALWAIERQELGEGVEWPRYWQLSDDDWRAEIFALREAKKLRFDDSTLVLLRVIEERPAPIFDNQEPIGPEVVANENEAVSLGESGPHEQSVGSAQDVIGPIALAEVSEPPLASLAEAIETDDALRVEAAVEEGTETLNEARPAADDDVSQNKADTTADEASATDV